MNLEEFPKLPKFRFVDWFGFEWTEHQLRIGIWAVVLVATMIFLVWGLSAITVNVFDPSNFDHIGDTDTWSLNLQK